MLSVYDFFLKETLKNVSTEVKVEIVDFDMCNVIVVKFKFLSLNYR